MPKNQTESYLNGYDLKSIYNVINSNDGVTSIVAALKMGLTTTTSKKEYQFTELKGRDISTALNSNVVLTFPGRLFYPIRLLYNKSSSKIEQILSLYIPFKLTTNDKISSNLDIRVIDVKSGTMFEMKIGTFDNDVLYKIVDKYLTEIKRLMITYMVDPKELDKFSTELIK